MTLTQLFVFSHKAPLEISRLQFMSESSIKHTGPHGMIGNGKGNKTDIIYLNKARDRR